MPTNGYAQYSRLQLSYDVAFTKFILNKTYFAVWRIRIRTYVFGPPGSGSISTRYGSGSFYHQAKIVSKTLIQTVLWLLYDFSSKINKRKKLRKKNNLVAILKVAHKNIRIRSWSQNRINWYLVPTDPQIRIWYQNATDPQHSTLVVAYWYLVGLLAEESFPECGLHHEQNIQQLQLPLGCPVSHKHCTQSSFQGWQNYGFPFSPVLRIRDVLIAGCCTPPPLPNPDFWHQNKADLHADPTPSFTYWKIWIFSPFFIPSITT